MKCVYVMIIVTIMAVAGDGDAAQLNIRDELQAMAEQIDTMKTIHLTDVTRLRKELEELKQKCQAVPTNTNTNNQERNERATLQWANTSMRELRTEMRELGESVNSSALLRQLHNIRNQLKQALTENTELVQLSRTQEARIDKLDSEVGRIKYETQQMRAVVADLRAQFVALSKEIKTKQLNELNPEYNDVLDSQDAWPPRPHKIRHNKMVHQQISRLSRSQDQLDMSQQGLQTQLLDVQRRLDRYEEPNWHLLSAKVDFLELENKALQDEIKNTSQKVSDFDKVHASLLELREDVENIENKADNTIPEIRKEISKLDISFAQMNAQSSYLREDQENLRQSVKAIAVSVSNAIDRTELDRQLLTKINASISALDTRSRHHFTRLNDHILKSEVNGEIVNQTESISLPELMGELKELQPVEHEYEALVRQLPRSCAAVTGPAGVYSIRPGRHPRDAWCDAGTTTLQRRLNGSIEFNRNFSEYVRGFGDAAAEHWLGLDAIHRLTADNCSGMRIDMTDIYGGYWYAKYDHFYVGNADSGFVLEVSGFSGNASDAFDYQNHMEFSAIDRDRDVSNTHCAGNYEGGWWFSHCQHVNINGKYTLGLTWFDSSKNEWIAVATSEMRLFRRHALSCPP